MVLSNKRTPAEHKDFIARFKTWRAQADDELRERRDTLLELIKPYRALAVLGYVYFKETTANPETYREWEHKGQAAKVEHLALLLSSRHDDGAENLVPVDVSNAIDDYLSYVFANLPLYYRGLDERPDSPTDPDPRSLVLMWELGIRMPLYPWQYRTTLRDLFDAVSPWMERSLGFTIADALAVELAFERITNAMLTKEAPSLYAGVGDMQRVIEQTEDGFVPRRGHEQEAVDLYNAYQERWSQTMARIGQGITLDIAAIAAEAAIESQRVQSVLDFFTTERSAIPADYFIPLPNSPLKLKPFLRFESAWVLPSSVLLLPAMQPALERALNPDFRAPTADKDTWHAYDGHRGELVEARTVGAVSTLLDDTPVHRNLKYKSVTGQTSHDELDALAICDGKLFLIECKGGAFSSAAKRGDLDAIEGRIKVLVTDAHEQAMRALEYIKTHPKPAFRVNGQPFLIDKAGIDEIFLITTTLEELGYLTAQFNQVDRLAAATPAQTPWVVPLHDLELVAKYISTGPEFVHYLRRRVELNAQPVLAAFDELDWLGRYFYDALTLNDVKQFMIGGNLTTASLASHKTQFDDFEHFENGIRQTPAERPRSDAHAGIQQLVAGLKSWAGRDYINAGVAVLDLPPKLQRSFAKRVTRASQKVGSKQLIQEVAASDDGAVVVVCTICGPHAMVSELEEPSEYGRGKRNAHLIIDSTFQVLDARFVAEVAHIGA